MAFHLTNNLLPSPCFKTEISSSVQFLPKVLDTSSIFLFLSSYIDSNVDAFISNISLGSSFGWYFRVDQFELIFLSLLMLQIFVLRWLEILPINMNNFFLGDPTGKKRRRRELSKWDVICKRDELAENMFKLLKKLDDGDCFPYALCELAKLLESKKIAPMNLQIPDETATLIEVLKQTATVRRKFVRKKCNSDSLLIQYEEAVELGANQKFLNETLCQNQYHSCPLSPEGVISHIQVLSEAGILT